MVEQFTFRQEQWGKKKILHNVVRDKKGHFTKWKKSKQQVIAVKKPITLEDVREFEFTKTKSIFESDKILDYTGQVIGRFWFKKGDVEDTQIGYSYDSNNVKRDFKDMLWHAREVAWAKSNIIGTPDEERVLWFRFRYKIEI